MVAMAVLAIALTAILSSQSRTMFVADVNDFTSISAQLGDQRLSEMLSEDEDSTARSGSFPPPHRDYFWRGEITNGFKDLDPLPESVAAMLQRIDLQVGDERRDQRFTITRYRFEKSSP